MVVSARIVNAVVFMLNLMLTSYRIFMTVNCPIETSELIFRTSRRYSIFTPVVCIRNHEYLKLGGAGGNGLTKTYKNARALREKNMSPRLHAGIEAPVEKKKRRRKRLRRSGQKEIEILSCSE